MSDTSPLPDLAARVRGAYLGFAVGDALGASVEFLTAGEIRARYGELRDLVGGGWLKLKPGQITDDTQMSLALGEAILAARAAGEDWSLPRVAEHFAAWLKTRPIDVGNTCRRGIVRYMQQGSLEATPHEGDGGNGAAMRNLPVVLATLSDQDDGPGSRFARYTLAQCRFTHHHPYSDAAALALGRMARRLLAGQGQDAARRVADDLAAERRTFRFDPYPRRASGYVVDTWQTVCHAFFSTADFESCVVLAVNQGGDADTNGALAAMLAGACYGEGAIPPRWLRRLDREARQAAADQAERLAGLDRPGHVPPSARS